MLLPLLNLLQFCTKGTAYRTFFIRPLLFKPLGVPCKMRSPIPLLALAAGVALAAGAAAEAAPYRSESLVTGLLNPRGLVIAPDGRLLVSEAGSGGPASSGPCITSGAGNTLCFGATGALGSFDPSTGSYARPLVGLPSLATAAGEEGSGLSDLTYDGLNLLGVISFGGNPNQLSSSGSALFGQLVAIDLAAGTITARASISQYELNNDPDFNGLNSNPYALAVLGTKTLVTDAGGNTLLSVNAANQVSLVSSYPSQNVTLPPFLPSPPLPNPYPAQAVPTGLATSGDYVYSAEFSGFPFVAGSADIYRTDATGTTSLFATGFTSISDIAFGPEGDLYILEYATNFFSPAPSGNLLRLSADGLSRDLLATGLTRPTGLAVDARGRVYVANNGDGTNGELLRLTQEVPGPLPILGLAAAFRQARRLRRRIALQAERPEA